jgi:putative nucleotidyltransferase with HDIG domain
MRGAHVNAVAIDPRDVQQRVQELPALAKAVQEVVRALNDDDLDLEAIARRIAVDPAMVSKILRAANSPFYGVSGHVGSVHHAVRLIGVRTAGTLVTAASIMRTVSAPSGAGFDFHRFWAHSLATAVCSQELARGCRYPATAAFLAGLLHDIGQVALATYYPQEFATAMLRSHERDCPLYQAEDEVLSLNHAQVGAWIAEHWHFTSDVSQAIGAHHIPGAASETGLATAADIVHVADGIVHALDLLAAPGELVPPLEVPAWQRLGIQPEGFQRVFERTVSTFEALRQALI